MSMYDRKIRVRKNWLIGLLMFFCITFLLAQSIFAKEYGLGDIPLDPEVYHRHLKVAPDRTTEFADSLPAAYDARDDDIVTPAKNQGSCGSCWAFASVGAMESHMLKTFGFGPTDMSEQQQVSCNTSMWGCDGGTSTAIRYWENKGQLYESCFPYTASDSTPCIENLCEQLGYRVTDWHTVEKTTEGFTTSLYVYGPSYWRFNVYNDFYTHWNFGSPGDVYVNTSNTYAGGHAVLLIGWDDNKNYTDCYGNPAQGAFLCKNSWGTHSGPNGDGTFWIAYSGHLNDLRFGMANFSLTTVGEICGNGNCDPEEKCTCPEDCGPPRDVETAFCGDELDNDCDGLVDCDDFDCLSDSACVCDDDGTCDVDEDCYNCPSDCITGYDVGCDNDNVCEPLRGEDCQSCSSDCRGKLTGKSSERFCCGDTVPCEDPICTRDGWQCIMNQPIQYCCGDGVCEGLEDETNCAIDCRCIYESDCDDVNECTSDTCESSGCVNAPVKDNTPCNGGIGICCGGGCIAPACSVDADCGDSEFCPADTCSDAGTCAAICEYAWPDCGLPDDCCSPACSVEDDPDCLPAACSECLGNECDGKCHPVKEGPNCPDCSTG